MALPALALGLRTLSRSLRTLERTSLRSARRLDGPDSVNDVAARIPPIRHTKIAIHGLPEVTAALRQLAREEVNIAIAAGLNRTSLAMQRKSIMDMHRSLDRPTPFTLQSVRVMKADRNRLNAIVYVQPIQAKYLETMVRGGALRKNLTPVVKNVHLDAYGNLPGIKGGYAAVARALKLKELSRRYGKRRGKSRGNGLPRDMFVGRVNGVRGLWQRVGRGKLNLLLRFEENARRERQWDFYDIAERTAQERLRNDMRDTLADALAKTVERGRWR